MNMIRAWRQRAGWLLITFMVLDALGVVYTRTAGASSNAGTPVAGQLAWLALDSFLAWRTWRRDRRAPDVLLGFRAVVLLLLVIPAVWLRSPYLLGALAIIAAQAMLLVSPAIRGHVQTKSFGSRPSED